jgi:hypothetical protein
MFTNVEMSIEDGCTHVHSKNSKESLKEKETDWEIQTLIMIVLKLVLVVTRM